MSSDVARRLFARGSFAVIGDLATATIWLAGSCTRQEITLDFQVYAPSHAADSSIATITGPNGAMSDIATPDVRSH